MKDMSMIDKPVIIGTSGSIIAYITANIMPWVSFLIGITTLIYMVSKVIYLFKHHGWEHPGEMK